MSRVFGAHAAGPGVSVALAALVVTTGCAAPWPAAPPLTPEPQESGASTTVEVAPGQRPPSGPRAGQEGAGEAERWKPPPPDEGAYDWIRLKEGEWLGKELKYLRQRKLGFESKKTGEQVFAWKDVVELRSQRTLVCVFEDPRDGSQSEVEGSVHVVGDEVRIGTTEGQALVLPRSRLVAIVPKGKGRFLSGYWSGRISLGGTVRSGNTNQLEYNGLVKLTGRGASTRFESTYNGVFSSVDGAPTSSQNRFDTRFDLFMSRYFFLTPITLELFSDPFQNIAIRATPGAGLGYYLIDEDELTLDLTVGAGYRATRFESVQPGQPASERTAAASAGATLDWEATDDIDVGVTYGLQVGLPDTAATNHHLFTLISFEIVKDLKLDVQFVWDHVGDPKADENGALPVPDDFRTTLGLGWKF